MIIDMKKKIMYLVLILLVFCFSYLVIIFDFTSGVSNSTKANILLHKNFIKSFSVKGVILDKRICSDCNENEYQIIIELEDFNIDSISLGNRMYPPYYAITTNILNLSVSQSVYDNVDIGQLIVKNSNSDELIINKKKFLILSKSKYKWHPTP